MHFELVPNLSAATFTVGESDQPPRSSGKYSIVSKHFSDQRISWTFNFERLIKSAKKKVVCRLTYDELATLVVEVESVLNSSPLTYLSMDDMEEPVTS